jgi:hypothetical protein
MADCKKCGKEIEPVKREEVEALVEKIMALIADAGVIAIANLNLITIDKQESVNLWPTCDCDDPTCAPARMMNYADLLHDMAHEIVEENGAEPCCTDDEESEDGKPVH